MPIDDFFNLDIDFNNIIDKKDLSNLDLNKNGIPDSLEMDLAGIKGIPDQFETNLTGSFLPDKYETDLNKNGIADKYETNLLGGPLKKLAHDLNDDGKVDAIDAMILRDLLGK